MPEGRAQRVVVAGMCAASAFLLMAAIRIPLLPQAPFLTYDPSDAVGLLAGVFYGPATGAMVVFIKDILFLLFLAKGPFGPVADFIAAGTFVAVTAWAFQRGSGPVSARLLRAALLGAAVRVLVMIPVNFPILALQFGMSPGRIVRLLWAAIVPFNVIKSAINAGLALVIAGPVVRLLRNPLC
jgi:riboflavin transporter FmnP